MAVLEMLIGIRKNNNENRWRRGRKVLRALLAWALGLCVSFVVLFAGTCFAAGEAASGRVWVKIVKHEHLLYVMDGERALAKYGVAVGKNLGQKQKAGDCRTPEGVFSVQSVTDSSSWSHDFKDGNGVIAGAYGPWFIRLKTGWNGIGIHGTHAPESIGKNVTEGCIRLRNNDLREFKQKYVKTGMKVVIIE